MGIRTQESLTEAAVFTRWVAAVSGLRPRVRRDREGWPQLRGRYGRLEWRGVEATGPDVGRARIYVYTDRPRMVARLRGVPGTRLVQHGATEAVVSMAVEDHGAILACARLLRTQVSRRGLGLGRSSAEMAALRCSRSRASA